MRLLSMYILFVTALGCSSVVSNNADGNAAAHTTLAIVPPLVNIEMRKKDTQSKTWAAEDAETYRLQEELYRWVLRRKKKGRFIGVDIMRKEVVNDKLAQEGFTLNSRHLTPGEMAKILGVDIVIFSRFETTRPASRTTAIGLIALTSTYVDTYNTSVRLEYIDAENSVLWGHDWSDNGTFSSSEQLINRLMRNASRQMPYVTR